MAAQGALGEVEVTNVEEVAEGRVRGLADARSSDVSKALAAAADRTNVGGMSFLLNIEMQKANMNLGYLVTEETRAELIRGQEQARQREAAAAQGAAAADFGAQTPPAMAAAGGAPVIPNFAETPAQAAVPMSDGPVMLRRMDQGTGQLKPNADLLVVTEHQLVRLPQVEWDAQLGHFATLVAGSVLLAAIAQGDPQAALYQQQLQRDQVFQSWMLNDRMRTLLTEASKLGRQAPSMRAAAGAAQAGATGRPQFLKAAGSLQELPRYGKGTQTRTEKHQYMFKVYQRARSWKMSPLETLTVHNISVALQKGGHPQHEQIFAAWQAKMERELGAELARRKRDDPTWESDFMLKFIDQRFSSRRR